jgi:hypothetical protein
MLIVTTTTACWLVDAVAGKAAPFQGGGGVYYGITFDEDRLYVAARHAAVGADRPSQDNVILVFDRGLHLREVMRSPDRIRDVHQIFAWGGRLFVCSTFDDAILECDLATREWSRWLPFGPGQDVRHINSVHVGPGIILLAGTQPSGWAARFDAGDRRLVQEIAIGQGTHNVWPVGDRLHVCSSDTCSIVASDGHSRRIADGAWVRGVARHGALFVGVSQNLVSDKRASSDSAIFALNDDAVARTYSFRGHGMIHDIRSTEPDPTHNGLAFAVEADWARFPIADIDDPAAPDLFRRGARISS